MPDLKRVCLIPLLFLLAWAHAPAWAEDDDAWAPTPPRLSYIDGEASYWRPGADAWAEARRNLALAAGDALYTRDGSNLEVQFGPRRFVRVEANTQLGLVSQEPQRIQFSVTGGLASFDLRSMEVGEILEVSTPSAVFLIEQPGYYRVEADGDATHFITRRGGEAVLTTADGRTLRVFPSEEVVVTSGDPVQVATYAAPAADAWDRWNDERSDRVGESISARYLPSGMYGVEELDHYGYWRVLPTYGAVWIPHGLATGWAPYSTGYWAWDPFYEWTWIDDAPWGWAPFHYGRWISVDGYWAWAPGPAGARPVYAPALVGFMVRNSGVSVRVDAGLPGLWWVALGWGEPVIPWWGSTRHRGHLWWGGWTGPRVVNGAVITHTNVANIGAIHFHNAARPRSIVTVPADRHGRERMRAVPENRLRQVDLAPVRGALPISPSRANLHGGARAADSPPRELVTRPVVSTRVPRERSFPDAMPRPRMEARPDAHYVIPPTGRAVDTRRLARPPLGVDAGPERLPLPPSRRYDELRRFEAMPPASAARESAIGREPAAPRREPQPRIFSPGGDRFQERREAAPPRVAPPMSPPRTMQPESRGQRGGAFEGRALPGQPANQVHRGRGGEPRNTR
ncbi:MAG TPA: FecR domain-containing protein [Thiobacillaceae bacterium]|nr:FecR domain-containing protein [Thiobacillaceae bacterium]